MTSTPGAISSFEGLEVAAFESRRAAEISTLISRHGGIPFVGPAMREVPLENNSKAMAFGDKLFARQVDVVIFMTGVGVTSLLQVLEGRFSRDAIVRSLSATRVVARGSKTVRALGEAGVSPLMKVPEPNTWREVLGTLDDAGFDLKGGRIALQEYGAPSNRLADEIKSRGADLLRVPVYQWALPEDLAPLERVVQEIIAGRARIVLFTNAVQADHLMSYASQRKSEESLRRALGRSVVCSVGPSCTESLIAHGLAVDLEPEHHKLGILVHESALCAPALLRQKGNAARVAFASGPVTAPRWNDSRFMKACRLEPVDATPVWLMRQAGRYMKQYRDLRARVPFLELCKNPDLVAEVTVSAAERIGADAAILFADLLLIAEPMGFSLEYDRRGGPWVTPALDAARIGELSEVDPGESLGYVFEAVRRTRASLDAATPLIGFAGAPFTLASYLIEGGASRIFRRTKALMFGDPGAWRALMNYLARNLSAYINGQIEAGAQAVQIFDSWIGCLSPGMYREFVLPHMKSLFSALKPGVPIIHFGTGTGELLELMRDAGGTIIGLDYRVELDDAWRRLGTETGVQGNLDPVVLLTDTGVIRDRASRILHQAAGRPGHIFNLGHGVLPETPVDHAADLVKFVHEESAMARRKECAGN